jgi:peroxiredoxin
MKKFILAPLLICCIMAFSQPKKGHPAPPISLPDMQGNMVQLTSLKGKVVLIDFWASWCGPCRYNNPKLVKIYQKYHEAGFEILGVSLDTNPQAWRSAVATDQLEWIQVNDNRGWEAASAADYDVAAIPASFLIDKEGNLVKANLEGRSLDMAIKRLLRN